MSESWRKASAQLGFSDLNQGGVSCFLGQGGPPTTATGNGSTQGCVPHWLWQRMLPFQLQRLFGCQYGGAAEDVCSSMEGVLGGWMSEGNGGACPNSKWYDAASAP